MGALAETKGATMTVDADDGMAVTGDSDLIAQATANLLDNAIKYAAGGPITLTLARHADGHAAIIVRRCRAWRSRKRARQGGRTVQAWRCQPAFARCALGLSEVPRPWQSCMAARWSLPTTLLGLKATLVLGEIEAKPAT